MATALLFVVGTWKVLSNLNDGPKQSARLHGDFHTDINCSGPMIMLPKCHRDSRRLGFFPDLGATRAFALGLEQRLETRTSKRSFLHLRSSSCSPCLSMDMIEYKELAHKHGAGD